MDFSDFYWQILAGALLANIVTGFVVYVAVLQRRGSKAGMALSKAPGRIFKWSLLAGVLIVVFNFLTFG